MVDSPPWAANPSGWRSWCPASGPSPPPEKPRRLFHPGRPARRRQTNGVFAANLDTRENPRNSKMPGNDHQLRRDFSVMAVNAEDPTGKTPYPEARRTVFPDAENVPAKAGRSDSRATIRSGKRGWPFPPGVQPDFDGFRVHHLKTGESATNGYQYAWLNHLQFSPIDPNLLLYCHEGTWHEVERVWTSAPTAASSA